MAGAEAGRGADAAGAHALLVLQEMSCGEIADYAAWCYQQAPAACRGATRPSGTEARGADDADEGGLTTSEGAYHVLGDEALRGGLSRDLLLLLADHSLDRVFVFSFLMLDASFKFWAKWAVARARG